MVMAKIGILLMLCTVSMTCLAMQKVTLQLKWQHAFQFAGYYAAQQQGYYRAAGLDVEIVPLRAGVNVVDEVTSQRAQFGIGTSSLLLDYVNGAPVRLVANVFQHSAFVLLARQMNALQDIHDLRGRRLMLEPGAEELKAYLQIQGLGPNDYQLVPHSFSLDDLMSGKVDAMSAYSIYEPVLLRQANVPYHVYTPRAHGIDFYGDNLFTSLEFATKQPELVQAFRRASMQGWVYALENPTAVIRYMLDAKITTTDELILEAEAQAIQPLLRVELIEVGYINRARWQHIADVYQQLGLVSAHVDLDSFLPLPPKPVNPLWYWFAFVVGLSLVLALLVLGYIARVNRRLQRLLKEHRQQRLWQATRNEVLQLMLHQHGSTSQLMQQVLQHLQRYDADYRSVLLLDTVNVAELITVDLSAAGVHELQQRLEHCHDRCDVPGLNLLRVRTLGYPTPYFNVPIAEQAHFCAFPLQGDQGQIPGVLLVWLPRHIEPQDLDVLDDLVSIIAVGLERIHATQALLQSEARHRLLTDHASDVIFTLDSKGNISYISPAVQRLRGFTPAEVMNQHISQVMSAESSLKVQQALQQSFAAVEQGLPFVEFVCELQQTHKNGSMVWVEVKTAGIYNEQHEFIGVVGITRDLTERKLAEQQMQHIAQHDSLTGLPNRLLFHDRLEQALHFCSRHERQLAVLLLDLNKFKPVNDQFGHAAGDELLVAIGERLRALLRASDTVARIGGDEFVVLLPQLDSPSEAEWVAQKIRHALSEPFELAAATVQIGTSIGIARFPEDGDTEDQLLQIADVRMYQQKQAERGGVGRPFVQTSTA